jgi:hypothetical protein
MASIALRAYLLSPAVPKVVIKFTEAETSLGYNVIIHSANGPAQFNSGLY